MPRPGDANYDEMLDPRLVGTPNDPFYVPNSRPGRPRPRPPVNPVQPPGSAGYGPEYGATEQGFFPPGHPGMPPSRPGFGPDPRPPGGPITPGGPTGDPSDFAPVGPQPGPPGMPGPPGVMPMPVPPPGRPSMPTPMPTPTPMLPPGVPPVTPGGMSGTGGGMPTAPPAGPPPLNLGPPGVVNPALPSTPSGPNPLQQLLQGVGDLQGATQQALQEQTALDAQETQDAMFPPDTGPRKLTPRMRREKHAVPTRDASRFQPQPGGYNTPTTPNLRQTANNASAGPNF